MKRVLALVLVLLVALCALVACNTVADNTKYYDKITKTLKLEKSYQGKSFLTDGVGVATLVTHTDGDTTTFSVGSGKTVVIRYYGIDTPESTGSVEKWGKAASLFTKEKLSTATLIVLESTTGGVPENDSYHRTLGYVWYQGPNDSNLKLLNLELVENGFSENGMINTSAYPYYKQFQEAQEFAQSIELRKYSKLDDPYYSTDPVPMTLKEFWENPSAFYNEETTVGTKVTFEACITDLVVSDTGTHTFTAVAYDEQANKYYSIQVYAGYSSASASRLPVGHLYKITGSVDKHYDDFQIKGLEYNRYYDNPEYTSAIQYNYYLTFDSKLAFLSQYIGTLYTDVTVVSSSLSGNTLEIVGTAYARNSATANSTTSTTFTFTVSVPNNYTNVFVEGTVFSVRGYQFVANSGNISIINYSDITIKK